MYNVVFVKIKVYDFMIYVGDIWSVEDNFDSVVNFVGVVVFFDDVKVEGKVDMIKVGVYLVIYSFFGEVVIINVIVKVKVILVLLVIFV